jgi:hypothetical protein
VDHNQLTLTATVDNAQGAPAGQSLEAVVLAAGQEVAKAAGATGSPLVISIPNAKLWLGTGSKFTGASISEEPGG